jgi:methyltransferase-like protein
MAQIQPSARFVGIDASSRQVADGWKTINALDLRNVELQHRDILDVDESFGEFDFIISHGVYSWVPPAVQNKMLEICRRHLAPNGVAYVSYNTYPGWHIRGIVRDMMLYRGTQFTDPAIRLAQAKSLVEFVAKASSTPDDPYRQLLQHELRTLGHADDYYVHHDHLEENNHPIYFHEFARKLGVNGLQYLGDADFPTMISTNFAPDIAKTLNDIGAHDIIQMEQYMDFVRCRYFRATLICRSAVRLNRQLRAGIMTEFWLASEASPVPATGDATEPKMEIFRVPDGRGITCRSPLTKCALRTLRSRWPASIPFGELYAECRTAGQLGKDSADEEFFSNEMLACLAAGVVEWRIGPDPFITVVDERPASTAIARAQAKMGNHVTTLRGDGVRLDDIHRSVLRQLDGKKNVVQLTEAVLTSLIEGGQHLRRDEGNAPVTDPQEMRELLGSAVKKILQNLATMALLLPPDSKLRDAEPA